MKKINQFLLLAVMILCSIYVSSQSIQMPKWPLNGKEIDFTGTNITVNNLNSSLSNAGGATNGYYDQNNNLLFHIIDTKLYAPDGTFAGNLYTDSDNTPDEMGAEIIVVPAESSNNCLYYVIYPIQQHNADNTHIWKVCYNLVCWLGPTIVESGVLCSEPVITHGGIAISDFIYDNGSVYHKLQVVGRGPLTNLMPNLYINGELRLRVQTVLPNMQIYEFCELDMSKDGTVLAAAHLNNDRENLNDLDPNNITIWCVDAQGLPLQIYTVDIGTPGSLTEQFTGVEVWQNPDNPNEKRVFSSKVGGQKYVSIINGILYNGTAPISSSYGFSNSQIELDRRGYLASTNNSTLLQEINPSSYTYATNNIGLHNPVRNNFIYNSNILAPIVYTLPDQVDQANYAEYTIGTEVSCCEVAHESRVKTTMTGVSQNSTTGDITINQVTSTPYLVSWTQTQNPFTSGGVAITDIYLKGSLTIEPGARLNITGLTIHFKEGESLEMPHSDDFAVAGPKLYLYSGSKLTVFDDCDEDALWAGINCSGGYGTGYEQDAPTLLQPYIYINNGTIEYAEIGIDVTCGGIVSAFYSIFKDNICDVKFSSWNIDNLSLFRTCDFYTTAALYNKGYNPTYHVNLWTATGIDFLGCDFFNNNSANVSYSQWGSGILSSLSSLNVNNYYTTPCTFSNLNYGIKASDGDYLTLQKALFTNCVRGAWLISNDAITATENNFDVSTVNPSSSLQYETFGLYVESSTGYQIEQNTFHDGRLGLVVYNSGDLENLVYRNLFQNLSGNGIATAFVGIGDNTGYGSVNHTIEGLQLRCNEFNTVDYSMAVLGGSINIQNGSLVSVTTSDIRREQGYAYVNGMWRSVSAYNKFENIVTVPVFPPVYRYFHVTPSVSQIVQDNLKYYYNYTDANGYRLIFYNSITTDIKAYQAAECPSTLDAGIVMSQISDIGNINDQEYELNQQFSELTSYNDLSLSISAQSANENNATEVYNSLYEASPYLTSDILLAYLNNSSVPELSRASLMLANSPLPTDVVEAVEKSDLSPEIIAYILKNQEGVNEIEQLQNQISGVKSARQVNYDHLMRATFNADTTAAFAETFNYVMGFMETQTDFHAKNRLVDMYIKKGMFDNALAILGEMEQIAITSENTGALNDIELTEIKIDILQNLNTESIQDVVKRHEDFLTEMAADYNTKEGGVARAILESAGLMENFPIVFLPNPEDEVSTRSALISEPEQESVLNTELKSLFKLYPNPANDYLAVEFINPDGACSFNIYSIKGELVKTVSSNQQLGFISINISDLQPGQYVINCPELQSKMNFVIVR